MIIELLMPGLSPTMEEGTIANWLIKPGDKVASGDVVAEVQTDKAVLEWEAMDDGILAEIIIPQGGVAKVNMVTALLSSEPDEDLGDAVDKAKARNAEMQGGSAKPAEDETPPPPEKPDPSEVGGKEPEVPFKTKPTTPTPPKPAPATTQAAAPSTGNKRISPVAARMAMANGINLSDLAGTGPDGRVVKADVARALANGGRRSPAPAGNPFLRGGKPDFEDIGLSPMRQVIGKRLLESKTSIPHFYVTERILMDRLIELRAGLNANEGVKISFNDLILKATALTLVQHPQVNATFDGQTIRRWNTADISVAVAIPDGLITPIIRGAEGLTLSQINATMRDLAKRATAGRLQPDEYQGGSFSLSNLGMFGIEEFDAVINAPQAAILAVGGIKHEAVVVNGELRAGKTMRVTISADHRVVDGADAAKFLQDLRVLLENPASLML